MPTLFTKPCFLMLDCPNIHRTLSTNHVTNQMLLVTVNYNWHLPSASTWIRLCATAADNVQHLKGVHVEERNEPLCALGKLPKQVFRYFQEQIL